MKVTERSQGQVSRYINKPTDIVKYTQDNGHHISWGYKNENRISFTR